MYLFANTLLYLRVLENCEGEVTHKGILLYGKHSCITYYHMLKERWRSEDVEKSSHKSPSTLNTTSYFKGFFLKNIKGIFGRFWALAY